MRTPIYLKQAILLSAMIVLVSALNCPGVNAKNIQFHSKLKEVIKKHRDSVHAAAQKSQKLAMKSAATEKVNHPRILYFYARWAEPCKRMEHRLKESMQPWADQVDFVAYDVDDEANASIIRKYQVSPIPTVLYLDKSGKIASMNIGFSKNTDINSCIEKIIPGS